MKKRRHLTSLELGLLGFLSVILVGALILMLPAANRSGRMLPFTDAMFTACTSVCVTGLVTVVPVQTFNLFGQVIILILIQIGGWGVIVCGSCLLVLLKKRIGMANRAMLRDYFGMDTLSGIIRMLLYVIRASLVIEGIGALCCMIRFVPQYGFKGVWYALFHSISAFCNAGVDLLGDSSLMNYTGDLWINLVTMLLIIVGGLGFIVWISLTEFAGNLTDRTIQSRQERHRQAIRKMPVHTKLVVLMTVRLILLGWLLVFVLEFQNPLTMGDYSMPGKLLASLFQSVTTRTAGFATVSQAGLRDATKFVCCLFMLVGGSPVGTAGGIKTVTIAVLLVSVWSILKGHEDAECFGRRIPLSIIRTALAVVSMVLLMVITGTVMLSMLEPGLALIDILYEVVSATATVGLTANVTPLLSTTSKWILIVLMYCGRVGPITLPMLVAAIIGKNKNNRSLPEEHIVVG